MSFCFSQIQRICGKPCIESALAGDSLATASQRRSVPTGYVRFSKLSRRLHEHCRPIREHLGHSLHDFGGIIAGADYRIAA
jgi:hypothetical protein